MQPQNPNTAINLDLVDQVVDRVPTWTWSAVKDRLVTYMVDAMPTTILERLTGDPTGDERAQEILDDYYAGDDANKDLIVDSFRIIGEEQTLHLLDSLQLDKITDPNNKELESEEQEEIRRQKTGIGYVNGILVVDEF